MLVAPLPHMALERDTMLIFVRHGETSLNVGGIFRGRADPPLTPRGEQQVRALGQAFAGTKLAAICSSPRRRATATAACISAACGRELTVSSALEDFDYGLWSGKTKAEVAAKWPEAFAQWKEDPSRVSFPGGESVRDVIRRIERFLELARAEHRGETIVAVTHDAVIRCAVCIVLGAPLSAYHRIKVDLTSTTGVRLGERTILAWVNCIASSIAVHV
jgi:probable phosphoglycerate mutase